MKKDLDQSVRERAASLRTLRAHEKLIRKLVRNYVGIIHKIEGGWDGNSMWP